MRRLALAALVAMLASAGLAFALRAMAARADNWQMHVVCSSHEAIAALLADKYRERPVATGMALDGHSDLVEIWANEAGRFAIVTTLAKTRRACIVGEGIDWTAVWGSPA
jgi:hypothetical protein